MVVIRVIGIKWYQVYNVAEGHCLNPIAQLHEGWTRTIWTDTDWHLDTLGWWFQITMSSNTVIASGLRSASNNESLNLRPTPFLWCLRVELPHSFSFFRGKTWWQSIWSLECSLKFASSPGLLELGIQASMAGRAWESWHNTCVGMLRSCPSHCSEPPPKS